MVVESLYLVCDQVCTHLMTDSGQLLFTETLKSFRFIDCDLATRCFFSIGLRSQDWLGHCMNLKCFFFSHCLVVWQCILGHCPAGRHIIHHLQFSGFYGTWSIPSTRQCNVSVDLCRQAKSILLPPLCLTVGIISRYSAFLFELMSESLFMVSFDHSTFFQASSE